MTKTEQLRVEREQRKQEKLAEGAGASGGHAFL